MLKKLPGPGGGKVNDKDKDRQIRFEEDREEAEICDEWQKEAETIVPNKIIKAVASKQSFSVAGECIVENNKRHTKRAFPQEWESGRSKESRRQSYESDEKVQAGLDSLRSRLTKSGHSWPMTWRKRS